MKNCELTPAMRKIQHLYQRPICRVLCDTINEEGLTGAAEQFGVVKSTISYWCMKSGIEIRQVCLGPKDKIIIRKASEEEQYE